MNNKQRIAATFSLALLAFGCVTDPGPGHQDDGGAVLDGSPGDGDGDSGRGGRDGGDEFDGGRGDSAAANDANAGDDCEAYGWCPDQGLYGKCKSTPDCQEHGEITQCSSDGFCVVCRNDQDCRTGGFGLYCDLETHSCHACRTDDDCDARAPHCETERPVPNVGRPGFCTGCVSDAECSEFGKICSAVHPGPAPEWGGACVACVPGHEEAQACTNGKACVETLIDGVGCFGAQRGTLTACQSCRTNSECAAGHACVAQLWKGHGVGSFCALKSSALGGDCPAGTPTKVKAKYGEQAAVWYQDGSGQGTEEFCVPDATVANCIDLQVFGNACTQEGLANGDCGGVVANGQESSICVGPDGSKRCAHPCKTNADCVTQCVGVGQQRYCNPF